VSDEDHEDPDQLIREAIELNRHLGDRELDIVTSHVAQAGFDDMGLERARGRIAGLSWNGQILKGSDMIRPAEAHFLRHVVVQQEWPVNTDLATYVQSLRDVVEDPRSGLAVSRYQGTDQLTILRRSLNLRGPDGFPWVLVDYRVATGHWVTAFQPSDGLAALQSPHRTDLRWLRHPR
jgi:hypothetical protein